MSCKLYSALAVAASIFLCCRAIAQTPISPVHGINFSPYVDGQDPNLGSQITTSQIAARLQIIARYTNWIRTFSSTHGLENVPSIARQFGLKVAANAWISRDATQSALEINNLIANSNAGLVDIAIVGSEAILRNDVTEAQLLIYMNQVRQAIPANIPVTTADVWGTFVAHPNLIAASDIVFANFYPSWEGVPIENAVCSLAQQFQQLVAASGSRPVAVSETGWPSAGNAKGAAVPSAPNANLYVLQYLTWSAANSIQSFYFEAFDESWKVASEGPQGEHWGVWDKNGLIKPGMDAFFNGQTAPVNCNGGVIPGPVAIQFTYVPPYGSGDFLEVQVTGVQPSAYILATYIKVGAGWWTKPAFAQPAVPIGQDGTAAIDIVTGGSDHLATDIAVFMIPAGSVPPVASGGALPDIPNAVASLEVSRTQSSISGTITDSQDFPIKGVVISDPMLGSTRSAADGKYCFYSITGSGTATLSVTHDNYGFPESPKTIAIPTGNLIVNFMGALLGPGIPGNLFPVHGSTGVSTFMTLNWTGGSGAISHDVYFGASASPPFVTNTTQTTYHPITLNAATAYYWRIVAKNSAGSTSTATWSFTTAAAGVPAAHVGVFRNGLWVLDLDGDGGITGADRVFYHGRAGDIPLVGDWDGDGHDSAGIFRNGLWVLDVDGDGIVDLNGADKAFFLGRAGDKPVTGDWNNSGTDKVGIFRNGLWALDYNGDGLFEFPGADKAFFHGVAGDEPLVGDWNGSGTDKIGIYRNGLWALDYDGDQIFTFPGPDKAFFLGIAGDKPVVGDWNGTGPDKIGIFRNGLWALDFDGNQLFEFPGPDKAFFHGATGDQPVIGDWGGTGAGKTGIFRNGLWALETTGDFVFTPGVDQAFLLGAGGDAPLAGRW